MKDWTRVLKLNEQRAVVEGSEADLAAAVGRGADLRGARVNATDLSGADLRGAKRSSAGEVQAL